jgi:small subunit ribosomal protein S7
MRGKSAKKRTVKPDVVYNSTVVERIVNNIMRGGKKSVARRIVYDALESLEKDIKKKPIEILEKAVNNVQPSLEIRPRRVGGVNYQVPTPVPEHRQLALAIKWMIEGARSRRSKESFSQALADELRDAYKGTGFAMKKKDDTEKMAEANKAFAHFQW